MESLMHFTIVNEMNAELSEQFSWSEIVIVW
jgi:hypothetical protein